MRTFILFSILTLIAGCTADQLTHTQQIGAGVAAGQVVYIPLPTSQPSSIAIPTSEIPYHDLIGLALVLGAGIAGAFVHKSGVQQGQDTQTVPVAPK